MSLLLFEGAAGTGKTTRLRAEARQYLANCPLDTDQRVLALTKYHGSRRRMLVSLCESEDRIGTAVECQTIDGFAWSLVTRWRALLSHLGLSPAQGDFGAVAAAAGTLLQRTEVAKWVARRHPLVVVDEMQDCSATEVAILRGLEPHVRMICGADSFQDLSGAHGEVSLAWAASVGAAQPLTRIHRTNNGDLLAAAAALRAGAPLPLARTPGFEVILVRAAEQGGAAVCWRIQSWAKHGPIALISATARGTSPFSDTVVEWVCTRTSTAKSGKTAGPYPVEWESDDAGRQQDILRVLALPNDSTARVDCDALVSDASRKGLHELRDWARRQTFVRGLSTVSVADVTSEVFEMVRRQRAYGPNRPWTRRVMTIHQAKNREFESVIVLWPLKIRGDGEQKRRLLYNAVTRARGRAVVIVQDPKGTAVSGPVFVGQT